jgi:hypothetical protein
MKFKANQIGLTVGVSIALLHLIWNVLIYFKVAQVFLNWIYLMHSMNNPFKVMAFNLTRALTLIGFTFIVGYVVGYIFTLVWNRLVRK